MASAMRGRDCHIQKYESSGGESIWKRERAFQSRRFVTNRPVAASSDADEDLQQGSSWRSPQPWLGLLHPRPSRDSYAVPWIDLLYIAVTLPK